MKKLLGIITVLAVMAMLSAPVMAATSGTTPVRVNIAKYVEITCPGMITVEVAGGAAGGSQSENMVVQTNCPANVAATLSSAPPVEYGLWVFDLGSGSNPFTASTIASVALTPGANQNVALTATVSGLGMAPAGNPYITTIIVTVCPI